METSLIMYLVIFGYLLYSPLFYMYLRFRLQFSKEEIFEDYIAKSAFCLSIMFAPISFSVIIAGESGYLACIDIKKQIKKIIQENPFEIYENNKEILDRIKSQVYTYDRGFLPWVLKFYTPMNVVKVYYPSTFSKKDINVTVNEIKC